MTKEFVIADNQGNDYEIKNIDTFYRHLLEFHSTGMSVHEEEGRYFNIDYAFREKIKTMFENSK